MDGSNFELLRHQAQYVDKQMENLELKLAYPSRIYQSSKTIHTLNLLDEVVSEVNELTEIIAEEKDVLQNNFDQMENFLDEVKKNATELVNELRNLEDNLKPYGYTPMDENSVDEHTSSNEENGSTGCEEQLEELSINHTPHSQHNTFKQQY